MKFDTVLSHLSTVNFTSSFNSQTARVAMLITITSFIISLNSCTQADTVAPQSEGHYGTREAASVLDIEEFEGKSPSKMWYKELRTATAGLISTEEVRAGKQSMRFSWKPSQNDGTNPSLHSELAGKPLTNGETERWYGYSMYLPSKSMANDKYTTIITQWHGVPDPGFFDTVPPMAVTLEPNNDMTLIYRSHNAPITKQLLFPTATQKIVNLGTAPFDRWVDFVVHVKWDPSGNQSILEFWQDGVIKVRERNIPLGYQQQNKPYFKVGLYCWTGKSSHEERVLYYDEIRIGGSSASYDDVKPGRTNSTARQQQ